jgi:riboflavin kinase/FMN adenylyltransferase
MKVIRPYQPCPSSAFNSTLVIGNFDAVHKGHQYIINEAYNIAKRSNTTLSLLTFEPHPIVALGYQTSNMRIIPFTEKLRHLANLNIDFLFIQKFNHAFSKITAIDFIKFILIDQLKIKHLVVGDNFTFGFKRQGNIHTITDIAKDLHFQFTAIPLLKSDKEIYSSSNIRKFLQNGELQQANQILNYNYYITGRVIRGQQLGKKLGFPTANLFLKDILCPLRGVYIVKVYIDSNPQIYYGVANLGDKPTFNELKDVLEVHILDFNQDIYGKKLKVELLEYLRPSKKFNSIKELILQIQDDIKLANQIKNNSLCNNSYSNNHP